jgi:hypothetical protein
MKQEMFMPVLLGFVSMVNILFHNYSVIILIMLWAIYLELVKLNNS